MKYYHGIKYGVDPLPAGVSEASVLFLNGYQPRNIMKTMPNIQTLLGPLVALPWFESFYKDEQKSKTDFKYTADRAIIPRTPERVESIRRISDALYDVYWKKTHVQDLLWDEEDLDLVQNNNEKEQEERSQTQTMKKKTKKRKSVSTGTTTTKTKKQKS